MTSTKPPTLSQASPFDALAGLAVRRATGRVSASAARKEEPRILRSLRSAQHPGTAAV
ncbi:hypothetical protein WBG99_20670 [Streptomyces sp. TG1A-60]|uniref:hypothetical protein n=1 Tax=Streptomyces sp. TG1A-60 TaxID=3129111 RepID=UPI0030CDF0B2